MNNYTILQIAIVLIIIGLLLGYIWYGHTVVNSGLPDEHGDLTAGLIFQAAFADEEIEYKEKLCFMTVHKGEMAWCYFGDENEPTVRQNSIEIKNNPNLIDQFLYFLETGVID